MTQTTNPWQVLQEHNNRLAGRRIQSLLAREPDRLQRCWLEVGGLRADFSRHLIDGPAFDALLRLAEDTGLPDAIRSLVDGEPVNPTEQRPALHTALRSDVGQGETAVAAAREAAQGRASMMALVDDVHGGRRRSLTNQPYRTLLSIGIGGSDLGPRLAVDALGCDRMDVRFLANVDGHALDRALHGLDPATTLVCVISKSFSTRETLLNATTVRQWLADDLGVSPTEAGSQFVAVTARPDRAVEFGLEADAVLPMWDWVGGRYSLWSTVGLPVAMAVGPDRFDDLLAGAAAMDRHFVKAPLAHNLPVMLALIGAWYRNVVGLPAYTVVPYDQRLGLLGEYLQQLDMESNGKRVTLDGAPARGPTGPAIWGGVGTNSQHAYFQWLHQGTDTVPVDFIGVIQPDHAHAEHHRELLANLVGQSWALMEGRDAAATRAAVGDDHLAHRTFPGNRPSTTLLLDRLDARNLGSLLALYEHKVFVQGRLWHINSFDQWGVELGKTLASRVYPWLEGETLPDDVDPATRALISRLRGGKE